MLALDSGRGRAAAGAAVAVAAGVATLVLAARWHGRARNAADDEERQELLRILRELSRRFFNVCQEVASIAKQVRPKIEAGKVSVTEERLQQQLASQCKVFEKLQEIQAEVAAAHGRSAEEVAEAQASFSRDAEVAAFTEGFRLMLSDALAGSLPVLPNVRIPGQLTEDKVLEIEEGVHARELELVVEMIGTRRLAPREVGDILVKANKDAWKQAFEIHAGAIGDGPEVFHSAVAVYSRDDSFAERRQRLDDAHQERLVGLFRPEGRPARPGGGPREPRGGPP